MRRPWELRAGVVAAAALGAAAYVSGAGTTMPAAQPAVVVAWDGDARSGGAGWAHTGDGAVASLAPQDREAHGGRTALELKVRGGNCFFNAGWIFPQPVDATGRAVLQLWVKVSGPAKPGDVRVNLRSPAAPGDASEGTLGEKVFLKSFCADLTDGQWHRVEVPLDRLRGGGFDPRRCSEIHIGVPAFGGTAVDASVLIDDIAFASEPATERGPATAP